MPIITEIRQQKRQSDRYSIYLDGKYVFSLGGLDLSASGLRVGHSLSDQDIEDWQRQSAEGKAYNAALRFLGYRARSSREMADYLKRKGYEAEAEGVITRLVELKLLDDAEFARQWVQERQVFRPRSRRVLAQELAQKGIARDDAEEALNAIGEAGHDRMLEDLIEKKRRQSRYQDPDKLMAYLARQGFGYEEIKKALSRLDG